MDTYRIDSSRGYFNINGGLRFSYWTWNKEFLVSPRLSIGFVPAGNQRLSLRFATGLYYQAPFYKEFRMPVEDEQGNIIIQLNSDIKSQRSLQFIAGADYTFRAMGRPFKISGEAYYKISATSYPMKSTTSSWYMPVRISPKATPTDST